jgi:sensor histidine kinase YesM
VEEFGNYLRGSIDCQNSELLAPLEHELNLLRAYLYIEKERFGDRLQIVWEVDESVQVEIPPLSIQPLVENAVKHGILKRSRGGQIRIRIVDSGEDVEIAIVDNGVGIEKDMLGHLLDRQSTKRTGIGLLNIDRRLKKLYGKGLQIDSEPGKGTTVSFVIRK